MTREEAAKWLAKRLVNYWDARQDNSEVERALLALTAQPEAACPLCGWPKPNVVGHCLKHDNLANTSVPTRGGEGGTTLPTSGQTGPGSLPAGACGTCVGSGSVPCDKCCWGDRCDDPTHHRRGQENFPCRACNNAYKVPCPTCHPATKGGFEEALDDYLRAEHELSLQFSLDGMDQGGPLKFKAKAKRTALLAAHAAAVEEAVQAERERGWVIVRDLPGLGLGYYDGAKFVTDNLAAIRFARCTDADRFLRKLHGGANHQDRVEEHLWIAAAIRGGGK